jgi:rod shape-determining protein MreC
MALSRRSSRTGRSRFTLLLLVLTSVTVLTLDFRGAGLVDDLRGGAATVFSPLRDAGAWVGRPVADAWNGVFGYSDLEAENQDLRRQLDELRGQQAEAESTLRQMDELADLNHLNRWTDVPTVTARIVGGPMSNFEHSLQIDKGTADGVTEGMPVVSGAGLVGRIATATSSTSVVTLITDPDFTFGIRLAVSGDIGLATGNGDGQPLTVDQIALNVSVNEREAVSTSGVERSVFPPDIPVGRVREMRTRDDQLSQVLTVEPLADIDQLSYVAVLQWTPPS